MEDTMNDENDKLEGDEDEDTTTDSTQADMTGMEKLHAPVHLAYYCEDCDSTELVPAAEIGAIGCPLCSECDEEMEYADAYMQVE